MMMSSHRLGTYRGIVRTPAEIIDCIILGRRSNRQQGRLDIEMIEIHGPVRRTTQKHIRPAIGEAQAIGRSFVTLVGLEILLVIRDRAAKDTAIFCAGDIGTGIGRMEVKEDSVSRIPRQ